MNLLIIIGRLRYAFYSPLTWLYEKFCSVQSEGLSWFSGIPCFYNNGRIIIGKGCRFLSKSTDNSIGIQHKCILTTQYKSSTIKIGRNCGLSGVSIWCFDKITIGNNVLIGANCLIMDGDAHQNDPRAGKNMPIVIGDNVWLGGNVVIMKGVTIGHNSIIGMNSLVTKDIPANVIAAGHPCKVIRELSQQQIEELEEKNKYENNICRH